MTEELRWLAVEASDDLIDSITRNIDNDPLDGDEVDDVCAVIKARLNIHYANG